MQITLEADYAVRIVDYLMRKDSIMGGEEISKAVVVPIQFTRKILIKLNRANIVNSYRGTAGGYDLARLPKEISLYDVFEAIEGPLMLNRCLIEEKRCTRVPDKQCPYHNIFRELSNEMETRMRGVSFADIYQDKA